MSWRPVRDVEQVNPANIPPELLLPGLKPGISKTGTLLPLGAACVTQRHKGEETALIAGAHGDV